MKYNRYRYNPEDEEDEEALDEEALDEEALDEDAYPPYSEPDEAWLAEHGYKDYPDDLPVPRRMARGPHTPEGATRYLDADYPLPGSFPEAASRATGAPAWVEYLEERTVYPGALLEPVLLNTRERLVQRLAGSDYSDINAARALMEFDRLAGFNPLFTFQYAVLNLHKFSEVLIFEVNGIPHALHWHNLYGYAIDNKYISEDREQALDDFYLFELVASSLGDENAYYPVVKILKEFFISPDKFWARISPPLDKIDLSIIGIHRS
jgi:hypothetical protein